MALRHTHRKTTVAFTLLFLLAVFAALAPGRSLAAPSFGLEQVSAEETTSASGRHPDTTFKFTFIHKEEEGKQFSTARPQDVSVELPPGLTGYLPNLETCSTGQFSAFGNCPLGSQLGIVKVLLSGNAEGEVLTEPLYNLEPPQKDEVARFGFFAAGYQLFVDVSVRTASDYGVTASVRNSTGQAPVISAETVIWGVPSDPVHNPQRLTPFEAFLGCQTACFAPGEGWPGEERRTGLPPTPFLSNPSACEEQEVGFGATAYQLPGRLFTATASLPSTVECQKLAFEPALLLEPESHVAGAPTGLSAVLKLPQNNSVNLPATSALRAAKVTLPAGMTINSAAANGLEACSDEQMGLGKEIASSCPPGSKLGTSRFVSPALPEPIQGTIYQRTPASGNLFRIWLATDELGLHLKLPGTIRPDKSTGQLTAEFDETPQLPVEEIDLQFRGGPRAPLKNPDSCGSYAASYEFTPWSGNPTVGGTTQPISIKEGCAGKGFAPELEAGVGNPVAGAYSPFVFDLKREEGEENISSFEVTLPKGQLAKLKGVPLCPGADAATGNCPAASEVGVATVATGVGSEPLWLPQPGKATPTVFLAGPYKGAPYSFVTKVPAQAGPFDLGTVTVKSGLYVNPETTQATVKTDALPQILEGVPVLYRTVHVAVDRAVFALAPTNCSEQSVTARVLSVRGAVATPADRFQVGDCAALAFGPSLKLRLKGGTRRGRFPALTATLATRRGEANIRRVSVALPHSEFLAQEHINTICTRVQFSAGTCPAGSVYGRARAVSPLLSQPLEGPVYLRSSSHPLPDLVVALHGQLDINLVGRIDSVNGGIRTTFASVPDAPVAKFVLRMKGGKKSLLVNSTDLCTGRHRATVKMAGQNGKARIERPQLIAGCR